MAKRKASSSGCSDMGIRKKKIKKEEEEEAAADTYTCELPELVINKIVSHLSTKDSVKVLSKEWASFCYSVHVLDIDEDEGNKKQQWAAAHDMDQQCVDDDPDRRRKFLKFLSKCVKHRENVKHLEKLRLRMSYNGGDNAISNLLSFGLERNVKELDLCFVRRFSKQAKYYCLPQTALNCAKSLTSLKLEYLKIEDDSIDAVSFPFLKTMSLKDVKFVKTGFSRLYAGCPAIEYLSLTKCHGWRVRLSSPRLKHLEVLCCESEFEIEATNLESLKFRGDYGARHHNIQMSKCLHRISCPNLRSLEFSHTHFKTVGWFKGLDWRFPLLERLVLDSCFSHTIINITSQNLKTFVFQNCGDILSNISLTAPNILEATVTIEERKDYDRLRYFLGYFDSSKKFRLHVKRSEICVVPEETKKICSPPLPSVKHLEVEIDRFTTGVTHSALMDSLRWMAPSLEFLSINRIPMQT